VYEKLFFVHKVCPVHELGNETAQFTEWAVSQIGRNIYTTEKYYSESSFVCVASHALAGSTHCHTSVKL